MEYNELEEHEVYDEYHKEIEENEESTKVINGQVKYKCVNHSDRAEKFGRISDGDVTKYANYALEYFGHRCALSGEKFYNFDEKIEGRKSNLSAEHVIALTIGGHDIVPNIVPTVLQYNVQKNGYYILDWWEKQKDINGKDIYSPYRLLKLVNFMMKSIEGSGFSSRKYHELLMKPNEIDKYLEKIEKEDLEETDNSKRKILSDTETTTTIDEDNKKILTKIPLAEGNIIDQVENSIKRKEYAENEMMDTFLIDAVRIIQRDIAKEEIQTENGDKITIEEKLEEMLSKTIGEIPFEVNLRNKILEQLEELGIENNKYTVANVIFKNTDILYKARKNEEVNIKETIQTRMENILPQITQEQKKELISVMPDLLYDDKALEEYENNLKWYSEYKNVNIEEINPILLTKTYLIHAIKIVKWMQDNNTTNPPSPTAKNDEERNFGKILGRIKNDVIKKYENKNIREKEKYRIEHPELEEIIQIIDQIANNRMPIYLENAIKIEEWMKKHNTTKTPRSKSDDEEEVKLGKALYSIKYYLINPYKEKKTEEEREQYKIEHPELEEVMQIIDRINENKIEKINYLEAIQKVEKWMDDNNTTKPPRSEIKENKKRIKKNEMTVEQQTEIELGSLYKKIVEDLIEPYNLLETDETRIQYKIEHPELEDVKQIFDRIKSKKSKEVNYLGDRIKSKEVNYLGDIIKIEKWMDDNDTNTLPRGEISKNGKRLKKNELSLLEQEEIELYKLLKNIKQNLITPYNLLETEEARIQYKIEHPELEDVIQIFNRIKNKEKAEISINHSKEMNKDKRRTTDILIDILTILKEEGINLLEIKQQSDFNIGKLIKNYPNKDEILKKLQGLPKEIDENWPIGNRLHKQKNSDYFKEILTKKIHDDESQITQEELDYLTKVEDVNLESEKRTEKFVEILITLKQNGIDLTRIKQKSIISDLLKDEQNKEEILKDLKTISEDVDEKWKIGSKLTKQKSKHLNTLKEKLLKKELTEIEIKHLTEKRNKNKIKEIIIEQKNNGELGENQKVQESFEQVIKEVEKEEQNYGR